MKIMRDLTSPDIDRPTVLTWGVFDGLHIGHQKIIQVVVERAKALQVTSTVITHEPHPRAVLYPETAPPLLRPFDQRMEELERLGIEQTIVIQFTREYARTTAEQFLRDTVFGRLDAQEVYIGEGAAFGHQRLGRIDLVIQMAQELGRFAAQVDEVRFHRCRVRSTTIRHLLRAGHVNLARKMLGRPYEIAGTVIKGRGPDSQLLVSTANLQVDNAIIPAQGVYITLALVAGRWQPSVTSIGAPPTSGGDAELSVECHILGLQQERLGQRLRLQFLHRLRDEQRSADVTALKQQSERDIRRTQRYFDGNPTFNKPVAQQRVATQRLTFL